MSIEVRLSAKGEKRYDVRLRDPAGREYCRTFRCRDEAERFQARQRAAKANERWIDPNLTFGPWAQQWLASNPAKSPTSLARDEVILKVHLLPELSDRRLASVTPGEIQGLVESWTAFAKPRTVRRQYDTLRAIFNAAVKADLIERSPCRGIRLPRFDRLERPTLDAHDLARLASAVGQDYGPMVYVGAVLGFRWGEVAGLRIVDLDFLGRRVAVTEQRTHGQRGAMLARQPKSTAGRRILTSPGWLMDMLAEHLLRHGLAGADRSRLVFTAPQGDDGLNYSHWRQRVWLPATTRAGYAGLHFHDLRRTAATALVAEGIDIKTAQVRLGHADPATTLGLYAQATEAADRDAAERLGNRFRPPALARSRGMNAG